MSRRRSSALHVRAVSRAHLEYTLGMFGLRAHRSLRPSTSNGSLRRGSEWVGGAEGEEEGEEEEEEAWASETRPKRTVH